MDGNYPLQKISTRTDAPPSAQTKFSDPHVTAKGELRAYAPFKSYETLWFNTGTLCNLTRENCYIKSSPKNDRLVYPTTNTQTRAFSGSLRMNLKRLAPLLVLAAFIAAAFAFGLDKYLTLDTLRDNRAALSTFVQSHGVAAAVGFVLAYAGVVALSLPGATIMTLAGGFLFGVPLGAPLTVIGATLGATLLFIIARSALGDVLRERAGPFLARMADGFRKDAFSYLLFLRLVPAFPFWAVNLAPALLGMRLLTYVAATALGIIPGTTVFSAFGASLGQIFDAGGEVHLKDVFSPTLISALVGLGILSLLPIAIRHLRASPQ